MFKVIMASVVGLTLSGCVSTFEIRHAVPCSALVPDDQKKPTPGAEIPTVDGNENWFPFGAAQTKQLGKANNRYDTSMDIVQKCEARDASITVTEKRKLKIVTTKKKT